MTSRHGFSLRLCAVAVTGLVLLGLSGWGVVSVDGAPGEASVKVPPTVGVPAGAAGNATVASTAEGWLAALTALLPPTDGASELDVIAVRWQETPPVVSECFGGWIPSRSCAHPGGATAPCWVLETAASGRGDLEHHNAR